MKKTFLMFLVCSSSYLLAMESGKPTKEQLADSITIMNVAQRCCEALSLGKEFVLSENAPVSFRTVRQVSYMFCSAEQAHRFSNVSNIAPLFSVNGDFQPVKVTVSKVPKCDNPVRSLALSIAEDLERHFEGQSKKAE